MEDRLVIIGAGDLGREIMYAAKETRHDVSTGSYQTVAFVDEDPNKIGTTIEGVEIVPFRSVTSIYNGDVHFIIGVGNCRDRRTLTKKLQAQVPSAKFATIVHNSVVLMPGTSIEQGAFVAAHTTIAIHCCIRIHAVVNQNVSVGHDCTIGPFAVICPGCILSGRTQVGAESFLGSGVTTYPGVAIGERCTVSAQTTVARPLKDDTRLIQKPNAMVLPG